MQVSVKQLFVHSLIHRQVLDLRWLHDRRLKNLWGLKNIGQAEWAGMKHGSAFEPPDILVKLERTYPNHLAFTEPYFTWMTRKRGPATPYHFVYGPYPQRAKNVLPDFWYMQNEHRAVLFHLRRAYNPAGSCFRRSALYTSAEQVQTHVKLLHLGRRNNYR